MAKKLYLSDNKKIAGVCAGIAEYFDIDPTVVRLAWLISVICFGAGILAYLLCWAIMPKRGDIIVG